MSAKENLENIRQRVEKAARSVGRNPSEIRIIGAVKGQPLPLIFEALAAGLSDLGENRIQEAQARADEIKARFPKVAWHMIGHLQTNKVRQAIDIFDIIHSIDSEHLAREIEQKAGAKGKIVPVLIEVKTSEEATKYGIAVEAAADFVKMVSGLDHLRVQGLMTVAPLEEDPGKTRPYFFRLRKLSEDLKKMNLPRVEMKYLSMGMSDDFEVAVEEGANILRIGRAIFGIGKRR